MRALFGRVIVALAVVILMVATLGVRRAPSALAQDESYESPNYPFALSWDETWTLIEDESSEDDEGDPIDTLTLAHQGSRSGESVVLFIGRRGTVDALECLDVVAEGLSDLPEVSDFAAAEADGEPVRGGDENYAYGAYTLTWESEGDSTSAAATLICASLTPGEELLIVEQLIFPESAFGAEAEALGNLIDDGLVINGRGGNDSAGTDKDTADEPADDGDTGGPPAGSDGPPEGTDGPPDGAAGPPEEEEQP